LAFATSHCSAVHTSSWPWGREFGSESVVDRNDDYVGRLRVIDAAVVFTLEVAKDESPTVDEEKGTSRGRKVLASIYPNRYRIMRFPRDHLVAMCSPIEVADATQSPRR